MSEDFKDIKTPKKTKVKLKKKDTKIWKPSDLEERPGGLLVAYGGSKVGKTTTCMDTLTEPAFWICTEHRNVRSSFDALGRSNFNIDFVFPEDVEHALEIVREQQIACKEGRFKYKSLVLDSLSHLVNSEVVSQLEEDNKAAKTFTFDAKEKKMKARLLVNTLRIGKDDYNFIGSYCNLLFSQLKKISNSGIEVTVLTHSETILKEDDTEYTQPALVGQKFFKTFTSHVDYLGEVYNEVDSENNTVFPPRITFDSEGGRRMAGFCGNLKQRDGKFHVGAIFNLGRSRK